MSNVVPISAKEHSQIRVLNSRLSNKVSEQHLAPVTVHEFDVVAKDLPIVFVKNPETGAFHSVCLMGFEPGQNFVFSKNQWKTRYIPAGLRKYPFVLVPQSDDQLILGIDTASDLVSDRGEVLFEEGSETAFFSEVKQFLTEYAEKESVTAACLNHFAKLDLFVEQGLTIEIDGEKKSIGGVYIIDREKLNDLADQAFLDLRARKLLEPIYTHLFSLQQVNNLIALKNL